MVSNQGGLVRLVRLHEDDPTKVETPDQIIVIDEHGEQFQIPISPEATAREVRARIAKLGLTGKLRLHVDIDERRGEWFDCLVR
jgi:hypothetical protein